MISFASTRTRLAALLPHWPRAPRATRSVEVKVVVDEVEEDGFVASHPGTLARALRPIYAHLDGRTGRVELTGVETSPWPWGKPRRVPLAAGLDEAIRYLRERH